MVLRTLVVSALALVAAMPASATLVPYADRLTMELAVPGLAPFTTFTFAGLVGGYNTVAGLTTDGVNFVGTVSASPDLAVATSLGSWPGGEVLENNSPGGQIKVTLPPSTLMVAADMLVATFSTFLDTPLSSRFFSIVVNDGVDHNFTSTNPAQALPGSTFFGVTSDVPIQYIIFKVPTNGPGIELGLDNFELGKLTASDTPEATTMLSVAIGLIAMHLTLRRRRATPA